MTRLLTPADASARLGLTPMALYRRATKGQIPMVRVGRLIRYREADVERCANEGMQTPPKPRLVKGAR